MQQERGLIDFVFPLTDELFNNLLTLGSCFCKGHLFFKKAQLISDGAERMVPHVNTKSPYTQSTETTFL